MKETCQMEELNPMALVFARLSSTMGQTFKVSVEKKLTCLYCVFLKVIKTL